MGEKKINVKLLRRVKRLILAEPRRFNMGLFAANKNSGYRGMQVVQIQEPPCGTVACIAGWAVITDAMDKGRKRLTAQFLAGIYSRTAAKVLGLDRTQASRLFFLQDSGGGWPRGLAKAYEDALYAEDYEEAAKITAGRIDLFIKTNGAE